MITQNLPHGIWISITQPHQVFDPLFFLRVAQTVDEISDTGQTRRIGGAAANAHNGGFVKMECEVKVQPQKCRKEEAKQNKPISRKPFSWRFQKKGPEMPTLYTKGSAVEIHSGALYRD